MTNEWRHRKWETQKIIQRRDQQIDSKKTRQESRESLGFGQVVVYLADTTCQVVYVRAQADSEGMWVIRGSSYDDTALESTTLRTVWILISAHWTPYWWHLQRRLINVSIGLALKPWIRIKINEQGGLLSFCNVGSDCGLKLARVESKWHWNIPCTGLANSYSWSCQVLP